MLTTDEIHTFRCDYPGCKAELVEECCFGNAIRNAVCYRGWTEKIDPNPYQSKWFCPEHPRGRERDDQKTT